jgi:hypothetical protein
MFSRARSTAGAVLLAAVAVTGNGLFATAVHAQDASVDPTTRFQLPDATDLATDAALGPIDVPSEAGEVIDLQPVMDAATGLLASLPASDWDVPALAATLPDIESAFAVVRDGIGFDAYRGVLRGDAGTLVARAGDSFDRAMLLRTLLAAQGLTTRYAIGSLDAPTAAALVERSLAEPTEPLPAAGFSPIDDTLEAATALRARRDHALLSAALSGQLAGLAADGTDASLSDVARHAWVQVEQDDGSWLDLDPSMPDAVPGDTLTVADETPDAFADGDMHLVRIRLLAEHLGSGSLSEESYLDTTLPAWVLDDEQVMLAFAPGGSGGGGLLNPGGVLNGGNATAWAPVLFIGSDAAYGDPIMLSGEVGGGMFGGGEQVDLASISLEVSTIAPDGTTRVVRQALADRVGSEQRASGAITPEQLLPVADGDGTPAIFRSLTHLMVSTGGASPRDQAADIAFAAQMAAWGSNAEDLDRMLAVDAFEPRAALDRVLVLAPERRFIPAIDDTEVRAYVAWPRIAATTSSTDLADPSVTSFRTDLMIDGVRTLPRSGAAPDAAARRQVWYGALTGALETEFVLSGASLLDPATRTLSSASFDTTQPLTLLTDASGTIPAAADGSLAEVLADGGLAVVPGDVATAHSWWEIAHDGTTRAVLAPRLGSSSKIGGLNPNSPAYRVQPKSGSSPGGNQQGRRGPGERGIIEQEVVPAAETTGKQVGYNNADKFVDAAVQLTKNGTKFPKI